MDRDVPESSLGIMIPKSVSSETACKSSPFSYCSYNNMRYCVPYEVLAGTLFYITC